MILTRGFLTVLVIIASRSEGTECINRIKRQARELELNIAPCDVADVDADRPARCILSPFRRFKNRVDGDLIAKYFSGGSLLGSQQSQTGESKTGTGDADSSSTAENVGLGATPGSNGDESISDSIVGAPNSFDGTNSMTGKFMAMNPLLEAAATWLQPQTLLGMRNKMDSMQTNVVGSPHQNNAGNSRSMETADSHAYPTAATAFMTPYSYVVGAPNPIYAQDRSDVPLMQPYLYSYDTIVGTQNPLFIGGNYLGSSPYWNYPSSAGAPNNLELPKSSISVDKSLDESSQLVGDGIEESKPDPSLDLKQDTDVDSKTEFKTTKNEDDSSITNSNKEELP